MARLQIQMNHRKQYWDLIRLFFFLQRMVTGVKDPIRLGIFLEGLVDDRLLWHVGQYVNNSQTTVVFDIELNVNGSTMDGMNKFTQLTNRSAAVFITLTSCDTDILLSATSSEGAARLALTPQTCDIVNTYQHQPIFHLTPPAALMFSAIKAVLLHQKLHFAHVYILFDNSTAAGEVSSLVMWLTGKGALTSTVRLEEAAGRDEGYTKTTMRRHLQALRGSLELHGRSVYTYLLVLYHQEHVRELLNLAPSYGLHSMGQSWLVAGREVRPEVMELGQWTNRNLVFLTSDLWRFLHVNNCPIVSHLFGNQSHHNYTNSAIYLADAVLIAVRAVAFPSNGSDCPPNSSDGVQSVLRSMSFSALSNDVQFDSSGYNSRIIYDVIRIEPDSANSSRGRQVYVGTWSKRRGLQVEPGAIFRNHFTHFENKTLKIAMIQTPPFVMMTTNMSAKNNITYSGFCVDIVEELRLRLNFNYVVVTPNPPVIGKELTPGGDWSGEIGMVMRGEADMIAGPVTITMERTQVVDFTTVYMEDDNSLIMKKPHGDQTPLNRVFEPFHPLVWVWTTVSIVFFSLFLALASQVSPSSSSEGNEEGEAENQPEMGTSGTCLCAPEYSKTRMNLAESTWCILAHVFGQSAVTYPTTVSGRTLVVFWWLSTILMSAYYTANLAAKLTAPMSSPHIESINQLAVQSTVRPLIKNSTSLEQLFKGSTPPSTYSKIWEDLQQSSPLPVNNLEALYMVQQGGKRSPSYAFMSDSSQLRYALSQHCDLYVLARDTFYTGGFGFVVPKDAIYRDAVSNTLSKMREAGLIDHLSRKYWPENMCDVKQTTTQVMLDLAAVSGAFLVCAILSAAALLAFAAERHYRHLVPQPTTSVPGGSTGDVAAEPEVASIEISRL